MAHWIYPLRSTVTVSSRLIGSKAARLSDVDRLGFAVPDGFILSAEAFRWFCHQEPLRAELASLVSHPDPLTHAHLLRNSSNEIRSVFLQTELYGPFLSRVQSEASRLAAEVAVRSSAPEEDSQSTSFAGILHTALRVSIEDIPNAIKQCWLSMFSPRAIAYCGRARIDIRKFDLALLIQAMLNPSESGVCFTANPVNGSKKELIVEAVKGSGEKLVSGQVTPWRATCPKTEADRLQPSLVEIDQGDESGLSFSQLESILDAALAIERYFGVPQDIEFSFCHDSLYILQARPITALLGGLR